MRISKRMLNPLMVPEHVAEELQARYMVYIKEPKPFVMQSHILTSERGTLYPRKGSQHLDWRMKANGVLQGWSVHPHTPVIIRQNNKIKVLPICTLFSSLEQDKLTQVKEADFEVYGRNGFERAKYILKHLISPSELCYLRTRDGVVCLTKSHSVFNSGKNVEVRNLRIGQSIDHVSLPQLPEDISLNGDLAWIIGYTIAVGCVSITRSNEGWKVYSLNWKDTRIENLEQLQKKLLALGYESEIINEVKSGNHRLKLINEESLALYFENLIYAHDKTEHKRIKIVPSIILHADRKAKESFLNGYVTGEGHKQSENTITFCSSNLSELQGVLLVAKNLGYSFTLNLDYNRESRNYEYHVILERNSTDSEHRETVDKKLDYEFSSSPPLYVYDIETETHSFQAGLGRILAHNSIVGGSVSDPITVEKLLENRGKGFRAETKASQPCISGDSLVVTKNGFKEAKTVSKLDLILGKDGFFHKITRINKISEKEGITVKTVYGPPSTVTRNHPFLTVKDAYCPVHAKFRVNRTLEDTPYCRYCRFETLPFMVPEWVNAENLEKGDLVLMPKILHCRGKLTEVTEDEALILGYYIGGNKQNIITPTLRLVFNYKDSSLVNKYLDVARKNNWKVWINSYPDKGTSELSIHNEELSTKIGELAFEKENRQIPLEASNWKENVRLSLFDGLIDSSGYWIDSNTACFETCSGLVALGFWNLCESLDFIPNVTYKENSSHGTEKIFQFQIKVNPRNQFTFKFGEYRLVRIDEVKKSNETVYYNFVTTDHTIVIPFAITHNTDWLNVGSERQFIQTSGEAPGVMEVLTRGEYLTGCLKPYFYEYFLKDNKYFKDWTRVVVRGIQVKKLDPVTKKPLQETERMYRFMVPVDQKPYALGRGMKKHWKPHKDIKYPFPLEWARRNWPEDVTKWEDYISGKLSELSSIKFVLGLASWMGPVAKTHRRIPRLKWYLLLDDKGSSTVRTFFLDGYPTRDTIMAAYEEKRASRRYLDYEGLTKPRTRFNPNKELTGEYYIIDRGTVSYDVEQAEEGSIISLVFRGSRLRGKYQLTQEEKGSDVWTLEKLSELELSSGKFVCDIHEFPEGSGKKHVDLRFRINGEDAIREFNLNTSELKMLTEAPVQGRLKECSNLEWMNVKAKGTRMKAYGVWSTVETVDSGNIEVIEDSPYFISMNLKGEVLNGYYVAKRQDGLWVVEKGKLPTCLDKFNNILNLYSELSSEGDPRIGKPFSPFIVEQKRGWTKIVVYLYDLRKFTRIEPDEKVKKYLPSLTIPNGVKVAIGLYPVVGRINNARVSYVEFAIPDWDMEKAVEWIQKNKLEQWSSTQIRE